MTTRMRPTADSTLRRCRRAGRIGRQGILDAAAEEDDGHDDQRLEDEGRPPADGRSDEAADERPGGGADAARRADRAERAGTRSKLGEQQRREDVDGWDQQRRADALKDRVADDQDSQPGSGRAEQRADAIHGEADGKQPLPAVAVGQLAAGDHQRGHDQQEDRDRDLNALDGRVQVLAHVVDHHVHVRAGEAADELGEGKRNQRPSQCAWRSVRRTRLSHSHLPSVEAVASFSAARPVCLYSGRRGRRGQSEVLLIRGKTRSDRERPT